MYKWYIDILMKNGEKLECAYTGPENKSHDVGIKIFSNKDVNSFIALVSAEDETHVVFVRVGEIAAFEISY